MIDRAAGWPVLVASPEGGTEIEHVAATMPERIFTQPLDPYCGLRPHQVRTLSWRLGLPQAVLPAAEPLCRRRPHLSAARLQPGGNQSPGADRRSAWWPWTPR